MKYYHYFILLCLICFLGCGAAVKSMSTTIKIAKDEESSHPAKIIFFFSKSQKEFENLKDMSAEEIYDKYTENTIVAPPEADEEKDLAAFTMEIDDQGKAKTRDVVYNYDPDEKDMVAVIYTFSYTESEELQFKFAYDEKYKWGLICSYPKEAEPLEIPQQTVGINVSCNYAEGIKVNFLQPE